MLDSSLTVKQSVLSTSRFRSCSCWISWCTLLSSECFSVRRENKASNTTSGEWGHVQQTYWQTDRVWIFHSTWSCLVLRRPLTFLNTKTFTLSLVTHNVWPAASEILEDETHRFGDGIIPHVTAAAVHKVSALNALWIPIPSFCMPCYCAFLASYGKTTSMPYFLTYAKLQNPVFMSMT